MVHRGDHRSSPPVDQLADSPSWKSVRRARTTWRSWLDSCTSTTWMRSRIGSLSKHSRSTWLNVGPPKGTHIEPSLPGLLGRGWLAWPGSRLCLASRGGARPTGCPRISRPSSSCPSTGAEDGSALVQAAAHYAEHLGVLHVTVHSGRRSVPVYERLGFNSFIATAIATPATLKSVATSTRPGGAKTHSRVHNFSDDGRHRVEMRATTRRRSLRLRLCCQATPAAAVEAMRNHFAHPDSWNGNLRR